jgi:hypothetical protein
MGRGNGVRFFTVICVFPAPVGWFWDGDQMVAYPIEKMEENTMFRVPIKVALKGPIGYKNVTRFVRVFAFVRPGKRAAERERRR